MNARLHETAFSATSPKVAGQYEQLGGCVSGDHLASMMASTCAQPISRVARLLVDRRIVYLAGGGHALIPLFQFGPGYTVKAAVRSVLEELTGALDDREIAEWFVTPNEWIGFEMPASLVAREDLSVVAAARADRFLSRWV